MNTSITESIPVVLDTSNDLEVKVIYDSSISYAFQQNAIPVVKELSFQNDAIPRKDLLLRVSVEPAFAEPVEFRLQSVAAEGGFHTDRVNLKLGHDYLAGLNERVAGLVKVEVIEEGRTICSLAEPIALLARNEWCGLASLPEILAAFVLPNDPAVMTILDRAAEILREHTNRAAFNGYQDKSRRRVWEQAAAIYKAIGELEIRYIVAPASFENTGQKVRLPSDILHERFGNCLDLSLLFAACCEQAGLRPLVLIHDGHAYGGLWMEQRSLPEAAGDDLQYIRKLATDELIVVFETTLLTHENPGTLKDAEKAARPHLQTSQPFRLALDIQRARSTRIRPLPIPGQQVARDYAPETGKNTSLSGDDLGDREFTEPAEPAPSPAPARQPANRVDQWKSRLLDLSLRNRLLNFRETKSTVRILSASPESVEDELAAENELYLLPKPKLMSEVDPRSAELLTEQEREDALEKHLREELADGRLHTHLDDKEHQHRLTKIFLGTRTAMEESGSNTLFAAVGLLEWRETEHSERAHHAPLLLVPVELKRKSVLEGFKLRRLDEEARLNITLMEMLRRDFQKEIPGLDPLPEDERGVDVVRVLQLFREAVRELPGWEVKNEVWLGQFSFTKFLLWKDLTDRLEALVGNRIVKHLIHEAGTPISNTPDDIHPTRLDDHFQPKEIFCPRGADSSQLAAVLAAAKGHDFVLEGPPGTGKSQTITNIIAHCLAHGKRVLFVAEKRAALDVVHRRLREEGLEPFCLELHSNKAGKAEVLEQFNRSLKFIGQADSLKWERRAEELEQLKNSLNAYTRALHRRTPCGLSAWHCFDYLIPRLNEGRPARLSGWRDVLETSREKLEHARELVRLLQERAKPLVPLAAHPLAPLTCDEWLPGWAEEMPERLQQLAETARAAKAAADELFHWLGRAEGPVPRELLKHAAGLLEVLRRPEPVGPAFASTPWPRLSADLDQWTALVRERAEKRAELLTVLKPRDTGMGGTPRVVCETWTDSEAERIFEKSRELERLSENYQITVHDAWCWLQVKPDQLSREALAQLDALLEILLQPELVRAPFLTEEWRETETALAQWAALNRERAELRKRLSAFREKELLGLDLDSLTQKHEKAQRSWFLPKWFGINGIRSALRAVRDDKQKPDAASLEDTLRDAARLRNLTRELTTANEKAKTLLGVLWADGEAEPTKLEALRAWGAEVHRRLNAVAGDDAAKRDTLRGVLGHLLEEGVTRPDTDTGKWLAWQRECAKAFNAAYESLVNDAALYGSALDGAADFLTAVARANELLARAGARVRAINVELSAADGVAQNHLGQVWANGEPDTETLSRIKIWGEALHAKLRACAGEDFTWLGRMRELLAGLFTEGPEAYGPETAAGKRMERYLETLGRFHAEQDAAAEALRLRREIVDDAPDHLTAVTELVDQLLSNWGDIRRWCGWQKVRNAALEHGLESLVEAVESTPGEKLPDVPVLFERGFRNALLQAILEREPVLRDFFGHEHSKRIERFKETDERLAILTRELIQARLAAGIPREQAAEAPEVKKEIGLLQREIAKKKKHIPVRQLLSRIPTMLPKLKPCVLMSPLSVAQYLEATHQNFDVVIFDEASQIPVWDAIGAIARGQQLIVVGDPKQLPPTNFFAGAQDDADDTADAEHQDMESILDELMTHGLRIKRLQWHYRSRQEGLITFSNRHYYQNELLTFPAPKTGEWGITFRYLPEARYDRGGSRTNRREAEALVAELVRRLRDTNGPIRSYGVVTFSQAQQQLIENLLDEERRNHPEIEAHFGDEPPVEGEPVFVKNLENVQGDERDVILFSICYGPDESGRVSMNFGPLTKNGGERRLNVAITRAKHEIVVFSGMHAGHIDLTRTRSRGAKDLKYFLDYAERGPKALAAADFARGDAEPDSEFERMVADRLRAAGYEVHHQVGCSGYRIDLGVVDPANPGRYLLGVECDGATYHRAATARDRDKLRQEILEGLGWRLHRVWSTDWWHDSGKEMDKLLALLDSLKSSI